MKKKKKRKRRRIGKQQKNGKVQRKECWNYDLTPLFTHNTHTRKYRIKRNLWSQHCRLGSIRRIDSRPQDEYERSGSVGVL